jgi:hypothetical protein
MPRELKAKAHAEQRGGERKPDDGRSDREARQDHRDPDLVAGLISRVAVIGLVAREELGPFAIESDHSFLRSQLTLPSGRHTYAAPSMVLHRSQCWPLAQPLVRQSLAP